MNASTNAVQRFPKNSLKPFLLLTTALFSQLIISCGATAPRSTLDVTNGIEIQEDRYPSVVLLVMEFDEGQAICTGTFVNDHQVLTAGHCVEGLSPSNPRLVTVKLSAGDDGEAAYEIGAYAKSFKRNPKYDINLDNGVNGFDVSVVTFPRNSAPATSNLASKSPEIESTLTIVGYGNNRTFIDENDNLSGDGSGTKRTGTNVIRAKEDGFLTFVGLPEATEGFESGTWVSAGSGDSGGPMFVNNQLVGVTSGGGLAETEDGSLVGVSNYVDLNSASSRTFLKSALD